MKISLSELSDMWFLIGTSVHLSFENRGPIEVNLDSLHLDHKKQLMLALQKGILLSDTPLEVIQPEIIVPKSYAAPKVVENIPQTINDTLDIRKLELKKFLALPYNTQKRQLKAHNIADYRLLLILEKEGKNRKSSVEMLEQAISKHQSDVMKEVGKIESNQPLDNKKGLSAGLRQVDWNNLEDIVESDLEEVEVHLGAEEETSLRK